MRQKQDRPLYLAIALELKQRIIKGQYPLNSQFPSEYALCEEFKVSRVTVRKALLELETEGLLDRRQGRGSYVTKPRIARNLLSVTSFHQTCTMMGLEPSTRVIHAGMVSADNVDREWLEDMHADKIPEVTRLCLADGEPVMLERNHYAPSLSWLLEEDLSGSVYGLLRDRGIEPDRGSHEISLKFADDTVAQLLNMEAGDALLHVVEIIRDRKGHVLHRSEQHVRGDRFTFRI